MKLIILASSLRCLEIVFPNQEVERFFQMLGNSTYFAADYDENVWIIFMKTADGKLCCTSEINGEQVDSLRHFLIHRLGFRSYRSEIENITELVKNCWSPMKILAKAQKNTD